jgi:hypothetical protein
MGNQENVSFTSWRGSGETFHSLTLEKNETCADISSAAESFILCLEGKMFSKECLGLCISSEYVMLMSIKDGLRLVFWSVV